MGNAVPTEHWGLLSQTTACICSTAPFPVLSDGVKQPLINPNNAYQDSPMKPHGAKTESTCRGAPPIIIITCLLISEWPIFSI